MHMKVDSRHLLHKGRSFNFTLEKVQLDNGRIMDVEMVRHPGATAIVALTPQGQVILLRQYRHSAEASIWEIPAGTLEPGEAPEICARRELAEEAGLHAARWEPLGQLYALPGYSDEIIHLFLARELSATPQQLDPDEMITVHAVAFDECLEMVQTGQLRDAKSMAAILKLYQKHAQSPLF